MCVIQKTKTISAHHDTMIPNMADFPGALWDIKNF